MADKKKLEKLQKEIEQLEAKYEQSLREAMFDRTRQDHIYHQLKKKKKELKELTGK